MNNSISTSINYTLYELLSEEERQEGHKHNPASQYDAQLWIDCARSEADALGISIAHTIEIEYADDPSLRGIIQTVTATVYFESPADKALFELSQHGHS